MGESGPRGGAGEASLQGPEGCLGFADSSGGALVASGLICAFRNLSCSRLAPSHASPILRARQLQLNRAKTSRLMF